ncbi:hypothetical protein FACS1894101_1760 [Betaproteobacteria bacterium]|nr:hypothetical protein FACS1894101_1760 [Betaproteobacteria bacterium]
MNGVMTYGNAPKDGAGIPGRDMHKGDSGIKNISYQSRGVRVGGAAENGIALALDATAWGNLHFIRRGGAVS